MRSLPQGVVDQHAEQAKAIQSIRYLISAGMSFILNFLVLMWTGLALRSQMLPGFALPGIAVTCCGWFEVSHPVFGLHEFYYHLPASGYS